MTIDILVQSLMNLFLPETLILMILGILVGIIFGSIPGLSGNLGIILFLPFTKAMAITNAILFLTCIFCGGEFGGSISAILIGTPGTNSATCTMLEGYPLAKRGQGKKALQMALTASTIGGSLSALTLLLFAPTLAKYTLEFGPPEYFAIALFGLSIIASLSGKSLMKGLFAGGVGIILSLVGTDEISGLMRFTFKNINLYRGVNLIALLTGLFALGNIIEKVSESMRTTEKPSVISIDNSDRLPFSEIWKHKWTLLKSSFLGIFIGIIPGAGTGIASFISYNEAKRTSKHPEEYGNGSLEGIAAVESSNNGVTSASLIPLLTLGLPGSPSAAVLIGAFTMKGLSVGPMLFRENAVIMYTIMFGLVIANVFMYFEGMVLSRWMAKVTNVPNDVMVSLLMIICSAGAISVNNSTFDLMVFIVAGIMAYVFQLMDIPVVPTVLGFVLGSTLDTNLRKGLIMTGGDFWKFVSRPITLVILIITLLVLIVIFTKEISTGKSKKIDEIIGQGEKD